jgi:hypothetical protein
MFLIVDDETHYQLSDWLLGEMILLVLKGLEEVNKYSSLVSSSLLVVKLILVERREHGFSLPYFSSYCLQSFQASINF